MVHEYTIIIIQPGQCSDVAMSGLDDSPSIPHCFDAAMYSSVCV